MYHFSTKTFYFRHAKSNKHPIKPVLNRQDGVFDYCKFFTSNILYNYAFLQILTHSIKLVLLFPITGTL